MKLYAILVWWNESPTWLSACVASLKRIGVDHVIAVDGRYSHFDIGADVCSPLEQADAVVSAAEAVGMGVTMHRPIDAVTEAEKRSLAFRLLGAQATAFDDWVFVIDADEIIHAGTPNVRTELAALPLDTHCAACRVGNTIDPHARPEVDNDVSEKTEELHQKLDLAMEFVQFQSRFWRVMRDMRSHVTHFNYVGTDALGVEWNLRPDTGRQNLPDHPATDIHLLTDPVQIMHRKNHRTSQRQRLKREYYDLRNDIGLERVTT